MRLSLVSVHIMLQLCRLTLSQAVDIENGYHIVQLVIRCERHSFPHRAFSAFAIPQKTVDAVRAFVKIFPSISHAYGCAQTLSKRAGGYVNKGEALEGINGRNEWVF